MACSLLFLFLAQKQSFNSVISGLKTAFSPVIIHDNHLPFTGSKESLCNSSELSLFILSSYFQTLNPL